jgi:VanZ family protein
MRSFLKCWLPVILWASLISLFSTDEFSSSNTSRFIEPVIRWIVPGASPELQILVHHVFRKLGHWSEYFVLSFLLLRAFQGPSEPRSFLRTAWIAWTLILIFLYAVLDEWHQSYVPSRSPSFADSMINFFGGACAVVWRYLHQPAEKKSLVEETESRR